MQERDELKTAISNKTKQIGSYEEQVKTYDNTIENLKKELQKALKQTKECEDLKKRLEVFQNAQAIVTKIEKEITDEARMQMESETWDLFSHLIWKKNTYGHISLNDSFNV